MDSDDEELCEYERKRLLNIKRNHEFLRNLGFNIKTSTVKKKAKRRKVTKRKEDSDEDDDEWIPGCEEVNRKRSSTNKISADNVPDLIAPNESITFQEINNRLHKRFQTALETVEKSRSVKKRRRVSTSSDNTVTPSIDIKSLPSVFHDVPGEDDFYGFTGPDQSVAVHELTSSDNLKVVKQDNNKTGNLGKHIKDKSVLQENNGKRRKSTRLAKKEVKHYEEPVISDDDDYIFCDDCNALHYDQCPVHGPLLPLDETQGWDEASKAFTNIPVPSQVTVKLSSIKNAGKGIFAKEFIPKDTKIGPYKGEIVRTEDLMNDTDTSYFWEIKKNGSEAYYVDGRNEEHSNWMRFVNCARNEAEQNLISFQYHGDIYYRTIKHVTPGSELLVWYGEEYAKELGLSVDYSLDDAPSYTCTHCQKEFIEKRNFDLHLKYSQLCRDANSEVFRCGKCGDVLTTLTGLQQHIGRHEQENVLLLTKHVSVESNKRHHCQYCNKAFKHNSTLQTHLRIHTGEKPYQCQYCSKAFNQSSSLQTHLRIHTGEKPYQCQYCSKAFSDNSALQTHLRIHTGEKPYQCQYCSKAFSDNSALQTHLRIHTGEKPYQCQYCSKAFNASIHLQTHLRIHTGEKPYQCQYCSKAFNQSSSLQTHLRIHTGEKPYQCQYCSKAFSDNSALQTHLRIHTGEKPYQCQYCSKAFNASSHLQRHLRIHTGEKPYQCQYCSKAFNASSHLQRHLRIHTGEKPYQCQYCSKAFNRSDPLQTHLRIHTGEKPYQCQYCSKAFNQSSNLQTHLRIHTGEKPYQCQYCSKAFNQSSSLRTHLRIHTNGKS